MKTKVTKQQVKHISNLANIPIGDSESESLATAFEETLEVVNELQSVDVNGIEPTHQVTGLTNVLRKDEVVKERMFSQKDALANAKKTHNGYFVVARIIDKE